MLHLLREPRASRGVPKALGIELEFEDKYVNGIKLAKKMGIELPGPVAFPRIKPPDKDYAALAL